VLNHLNRHEAVADDYTLECEQEIIEFYTLLFVVWLDRWSEEFTRTLCNMISNIVRYNMIQGPIKFAMTGNPTD